MSYSRYVLAIIAMAAFSFGVAAQEAIPVSDTGAQVRTWTEKGAKRSAFSRDGGSTWVPLSVSDDHLTWRNRRLDPLVGDPGVPPSLQANDANRLFYVQFVTDIVPQYAEAMTQLGADYTRYYPNKAYITRIDRDRIQAVRGQRWVRAVMELEPGHKLDPEIQADLLRGELETARYNIMLVDKHRDAALLEARILDLGGVLEARAEGGILVEATLTHQQLMDALQENTVLWVDRWSAPEYDMDNLRIQAGVDYVEAMAGMDGKGIRGHVNEGVHNHPEFGERPPYRSGPIGLLNTTPSGHGTNTAGEIYAQGLPNGVKGVLPYAQLIFTASASSNRYSMVQTLVDPNQQYKAMMMTQSWGGSRTTSYTSTSALLDDILFDFDHMFSTNSQSNAGARPSRPEAWAKNVAGIGGFLHRNNPDPDDDCWCNTGSIGPAQDGRVGVSFAAYYDGIRTTSLSSGYTNTFGGTSGATPIVNGLAGGAIQMFTDGHFGYPGVDWTQRFNAIPNLTTTRVLLAVGTRQVSFTGPNNAERVEQGWGLPNLQDLYDNRDNILVLDEEDVLTTGDERTYRVWVKPNTDQFRASMHHLEDEAVPSAIPTRLNSLDLKVAGPDGTIYWGNNEGILNGPFSSAGGPVNDVDIHENVFLDQPESGVYEVTVRASAVRHDTHKETPEVDADFALAIRGIGGGRDTSGIVVDLISNSAGQFDVSAANVPATGWTRGFTLMSFDTGRHLSLGNTFGLERDALTTQVIERKPEEGHVFSFTNSGNPGVYPSATFSFGPGAAAEFQGKTVDAVVVLFNGNQIVDVSNVARVTVQ